MAARTTRTCSMASPASPRFEFNGCPETTARGKPCNGTRRVPITTVAIPALSSPSTTRPAVAWQRGQTGTSKAALAPSARTCATI